MTVRATLAAVALVLLPVAGGAAPKDGKRPTCKLLVTNKTPYKVKVHVNGVYWGWVAANQSFNFTGIPQGNTLVYGDTQYADNYWGPKSLRCTEQASWELSF